MDSRMQDVTNVWPMLSSRLIWLVCLLLLAAPADVCGQDTLRVVFYNVENLFDCKDNPDKDDDMFLPDAIYAWHEGRLKRKLSAIGKTIIAVGEKDIPSVVGLCEVENEEVVERLVKYSPLAKVDYRYVVTSSPDRRGINVAMLYRRDQFRLLGHEALSVHPADNQNSATRDILHCYGLAGNLDTLDIFVCHFPSRYGGAGSAIMREAAASVLCDAVDSLMNAGRSNIIIMGDFNAPHSDKVMQSILTGKGRCLTNIMSRYSGREDFGSYKYHGRWETIDHIIVPCSMTAGGAFSVSGSGIFSAPFLLERDAKYMGMKPFRTYYGMKYIGGFSDHLPVYADIVVR